jgi:hypothetical protein
MLRLIGLAAIGYATWRLGRRLKIEQRPADDWQPASVPDPYQPVMDEPPSNFGAPDAMLDDANPAAGAGARNADIERGDTSRLDARLD